MKALEEICSVVMLPTNDIEADICKYLPGGMLAYRSTELAYHTNQHLYICRNTEIKENDYAYFNGDIKRAVSNVVLSKDNTILKIEASTNRSLRLLDIPEWFVKKFVIMQGKISKVKIHLDEIETLPVQYSSSQTGGCIDISLVDNGWDDIRELFEKSKPEDDTSLYLFIEWMKEQNYSVPTKL